LPDVNVSVFEQSSQRGRSRKQCARAQLPESRRAFPVTVLAPRVDGDKRYSRFPRRNRVVHVVANVERASRIASFQDLEKPFRVRLDSLYVAHRNHAPEECGSRPLFERVSEFLARASREEIQFIASGPPFDLPRRHKMLLIAHVSGLAVRAPIKSLERFARFFIRGGTPERPNP